MALCHFGRRKVFLALVFLLSETLLSGTGTVLVHESVRIDSNRPRSPGMFGTNVVQLVELRFGRGQRRRNIM